MLLPPRTLRVDVALATRLSRARGQLLAADPLGRLRAEFAGAEFTAHRRSAARTRPRNAVRAQCRNAARARG